MSMCHTNFLLDFRFCHEFCLEHEKRSNPKYKKTTIEVRTFVCLLAGCDPCKGWELGNLADMLHGFRFLPA